MVNHIHLHLFSIYHPFMSNQSAHIIYNFHPSTKSYIIWSLKFGQVYIFNLPILLTQNGYLNYS
jgi:hypothetical protein